MGQSLGILDLSQFIVAAIFIILIPGPNSIYVLKTGIRNGVIAGYRATLGILIGDGLIMFTVYLGVAALINRSPLLFTLLRVFSATFLLYLSSMILLNLYREWIKRASATNQKELDISLDTSHRTPKSEKRERYFHRAFLLSITNPKGLLFFLAFFSQFIDPTYTPTYLPFLILALILSTISFIYLSSLIFIGQKLLNLVLRFPILGFIGNLIVASLFLFFALKIIFG